jgi:AhpD family alkylhydroperoxidase
MCVYALDRGWKAQVKNEIGELEIKRKLNMQACVERDEGDLRVRGLRQECGVEDLLLESVRLSASQINGYAYCVDMHTQDAGVQGEQEQQLYELVAWEMIPFCTEPERTALAWIEAVTIGEGYQGLLCTKGPNAGASRSRKSRVEQDGSSVSGKHESDGRQVTLWTVGHSTRPIIGFIGLLQAHGIRRLVDVRTIPRSRHNPQFNQDQLSDCLEEAGIHYLHMPALGGLRHARRDSINTAWRNTSFRGFADYMQTPEFEIGLQELIRLARDERTAIMCAEAVPWRCHRSLIADALLVCGIKVEEIASETRTRPHTLTPWSRVIGRRVTYPAPPTEGNDSGEVIATAHPKLRRGPSR